MTVPQPSPVRTVAAPAGRRGVPARSWAVLLTALAGCAAGEMRDGFGEIAVHLRATAAAEKAFLHRGDLFHDCCSSPPDFKHGFRDGYVEVALNGEDCCAPVTPPSCYWGCGSGDPCRRAELLNCYYDGWTHGAIAAAQDGVVGLNTVPIRNRCGGYGAPSGPLGPLPAGPPPFDPDGGNPSDAGAFPPPAPGLEGPEEWDTPLDGGPTPAPILLLPEPGAERVPERGESSVGGSTDGAPDRLPEPGAAEPGAAEPGAGVPPADRAPEGPRVTPLWGVPD